MSPCRDPSLGTRELWHSRDATDPRGVKDRDARDVREVRDSRYYPRDGRDVWDIRDVRDFRDVREPRDERREMRDTRDYGRSPRFYEEGRSRARDAEWYGNALPPSHPSTRGFSPASNPAFHGRPRGGSFHMNDQARYPSILIHCYQRLLTVVY